MKTPCIQSFHAALLALLVSGAGGPGQPSADLDPAFADFALQCTVAITPTGKKGMGVEFFATS